MLISSLMESVFEGTLLTCFDDVCTIYHRTDEKAAAVPGTVSDGMGGFTTAASDSMGGSNVTYDSGLQNVPCRMDQLPGGGFAQKQDVATQKTRQLLYVPESTDAGRFDKVVTNAGNNGVNRAFHILDIYRETGELDITLLIEETTF